eukprot:8439631-Karenia_brevis.AAC.1
MGSQEASSSNNQDQAKVIEWTGEERRDWEDHLDDKEQIARESVERDDDEVSSFSEVKSEDAMSPAEEYFR